jgi:HlyD family secretion protein
MIAPASGVVADVLARKGETLNTGEPVVSLLPPENIFIRFFIPEAMLSQVHRGDKVALHCDRCPTDLTGEISFIAPTAEYTPPVIFSEESRAKLVYMIEARPPASQEIQWNPGEPVIVKPISMHGVQ